MEATLHCSVRASRGSGFSCCRARVPERRLSSCGAQLSSCGARAYLPRGMWDLPGPGIEPVSPAVAGRLLTTGPPRMSPAPSLFCFEQRLHIHKAEVRSGVSGKLALPPPRHPGSPAHRPSSLSLLSLRVHPQLCLFMPCSPHSQGEFIWSNISY